MKYYYEELSNMAMKYKLFTGRNFTQILSGHFNSFGIYIFDNTVGQLMALGFTHLFSFFFFIIFFLYDVEVSSLFSNEDIRLSIICKILFTYTPCINLNLI